MIITYFKQMEKPFKIILFGLLCVFSSLLLISGKCEGFSSGSSSGGSTNVTAWENGIQFRDFGVSTKAYGFDGDRKIASVPVMNEAGFYMVVDKEEAGTDDITLTVSNIAHIGFNFGRDASISYTDISNTSVYIFGNAENPKANIKASGADEATRQMVGPLTDLDIACYDWKETEVDLFYVGKNHKYTSESKLDIAVDKIYKQAIYKIKPNKSNFQDIVWDDDNDGYLDVYLWQENWGVEVTPILQDISVDENKSQLIYINGGIVVHTDQNNSKTVLGFSYEIDVGGVMVDFNYSFVGDIKGKENDFYKIVAHELCHQKLHGNLIDKPGTTKWLMSQANLSEWGERLGGDDWNSIQSATY